MRKKPISHRVYDDQITPGTNFSQELPTFFTIDQIRRKGNMQTLHNLLDLERGDRVAKDVTDAGRIPIETAQLLQYTFRIYDKRIYIPP